jgi:hypothetical protein
MNSRMKDLKNLISPIQKATGVKDPVAWMISQIPIRPSMYDQRVWNHIKATAFQDFLQEIYIQLIIFKPRTKKELLRCVYRAFYHTARQLGWRKTRSGWQYDFVYR